MKCEKKKLSKILPVPVVQADRSAVPHTFGRALAVAVRAALERLGLGFRRLQAFHPESAFNANCDCGAHMKQSWLGPLLK